MRMRIYRGRPWRCRRCLLSVYRLLAQSIARAEIGEDRRHDDHQRGGGSGRRPHDRRQGDAQGHASVLPRGRLGEGRARTPTFALNSGCPTKDGRASSTSTATAATRACSPTITGRWKRRSSADTPPRMTDLGTAPATPLNGDALVGHPDKWKDWGMLGTHEAAVAGKADRQGVLWRRRQALLLHRAARQAVSRESSKRSISPRISTAFSPARPSSTGRGGTRSP